MKSVRASENKTTDLFEIRAPEKTLTDPEREEISK
jgi:hypothetical protein